MNAELFDPKLRERYQNPKVIQDCQILAAEILEPAPLRSADEWADERRILPPESAEPGQWRSSRVPYMSAICRAAVDPAYRYVVMAMGSQMSKTESALNIIGHRLCDGPYMPVLFIMPTEKAARSMSNDRFQKMIDSTQELKDRLHAGHADKVTEKFFSGVRLGFGWAGSATELASHPAGLVIVDELDRMCEDVGDEGDPVTVVSARTFTYLGAKIIISSTPTTEGTSQIWKWYRKGTMHKWSWHCPSCGERFVPMLSMLKWPQDPDEATLRKQARVECPHCAHMIADRHREQMNAGGVYVPHMIDDRGEEVETEAPRETDVASFWVSGLASPWVSFGDSAVMMVRAYNSRDPAEIQAVINTRFGELFKTHGDAPDWSQVWQLRQAYAPGSIPRGVQFLTMGVDVQKAGLYYVIRGWGANSESWLIRHGYIAGETEYDNVWLALATVQAELFDNGSLPINRGFIDSGYRPGDRWKRPENQVYMHVRRHRGQMFATKGHDSQDRPIKAADIDVSIGGRVIKGGVKLYHLDTDYMKSWLYARIRWPAGEPGGFHLHNETDEDYCRQIVSEALVLKPSGRRLWVQVSRDNHYLDCEVNAFAAAMTLQVHALRALPAQTTAQQQPEQAATPPRQTYIQQRPQGSWFRR